MTGCRRVRPKQRSSWFTVSPSTPGDTNEPGSLFADAGFHVRGFDLVGAGGSGGRRWHVEQVGRLPRAIGVPHGVGREGLGRPVVLMGHSVGGAICLGYLIDDYPKPDLAVLSAPALAGGDGWQKTVVPILGGVFPRLAIPNPVKGEHLSRDPRVAEAYFADPLVNQKATLGFGSEALSEIERLNDEFATSDHPDTGDSRWRGQAGAQPGVPRIWATSHAWTVRSTTVSGTRLSTSPRGPRWWRTSSAGSTRSWPLSSHASAAAPCPSPRRGPPRMPPRSRRRRNGG